MNGRSDQQYGYSVRFGSVRFRFVVFAMGPIHFMCGSGSCGFGSVRFGIWNIMH